MSKLYGIDGGFFDGPRAYRIVSEKLLKSHRTNADKEFYRTAERIQRDSRLSDGALAADYAQKALAFLVHIRPYLAQSYDDDETTDYLISMMHIHRGCQMQRRGSTEATGRQRKGNMEA